MNTQKKEKNTDSGISELQNQIVSTADSRYYSFTPLKKHTQNTYKKPIANVYAYEYVKQDMLKTLIISSILIGTNTILFLLIQFKIIQLSLFGY